MAMADAEARVPPGFVDETDFGIGDWDRSSSGRSSGCSLLSLLPASVRLNPVDPVQYSLFATFVTFVAWNHTDAEARVPPGFSDETDFGIGDWDGSSSGQSSGCSLLSLLPVGGRHTPCPWIMQSTSCDEWLYVSSEGRA